MAVVYGYIEEGAIVDVDVLEPFFIAIDLDVLEKLLRACADIKPSSLGLSSSSDSNNSKLVQILLDPGVNAINAFLEAVYPPFSILSPRYQSTLPPAKYHVPTPPRANAREIRFGRAFPLAFLMDICAEQGGQQTNWFAKD